MHHDIKLLSYIRAKVHANRQKTKQNKKTNKKKQKTKTKKNNNKKKTKKKQLEITHTKYRQKMHVKHIDKLSLPQVMLNLCPHSGSILYLEAYAACNSCFPHVQPSLVSNTVHEK